MPPTADTAPAPMLLTAREAADTLRISAKTLWTLDRDGRLRAVRIGRAVRYDPADLRAFIEAAKGGAP